MKKWWPVLVAAVVLTAAVAAFLRTPGEDTVSTRREVPATTAVTETSPSSGTAATKPHRPKPPAAFGALRVYVFSGGVGVEGCTVQLVHETTGVRIDAVTDVSGTAEVAKAPVGGWHVGTRHGSYVPVDREVDVLENRTADIRLELELGGRIVGRVVDAAGRPIPDAEAFLLDAEREVDLGPAFRAACDESGAFAIDGVPLTTLGICATAEHYQPRVQSGLKLSTPGDSISVEIRLDAGTFIRGRVIDDLGNPVPGALLTAGNEFVRAAKADEEGRFTISGLGDQAMHMSVAATAHGTVFLHDIRPNTDGLVVRLPRGGTVEGTVSGEGTAVLLSRWDDYWRREQVVATIALQGPSFRVTGLAPGTYQIWAEGPGGTSEKGTVEVRPDAVTGGVMLSLQ